MEAVIAGPELASKGCHRLCSVLNDAPAEVGLVSTDIIEEFIREDGLLPGNQINLLLVLYFAEVDPSAQGKGIIAGLATESLIDKHLI